MKLPDISSKQQLLDYYSDILENDEIEFMKFALYDLDDEQQAAEAAVIVKKADEQRATKAEQKSSVQTNK